MGDIMDELNVSVKVGKSYKNRGWALNRASTYDLIPFLPYEEECDIVVDGIPAKAHFNILPRIFYKNTEKELMNHLKNLSENSVDRVELKLLLNKSNEMVLNSSGHKYYEDHIKKLENKLKINEKLLEDIKNENLLLISELNKYKSKYDNSLKEVNSNSYDEYDYKIDELNQEIAYLKDKNMELEVEFAKLLKKWNSEKKSRELVKEFKSKLDELDFE